MSGMMVKGNSAVCTAVNLMRSKKGVDTKVNGILRFLSLPFRLRAKLPLIVILLTFIPMTVLAGFRHHIYNSAPRYANVATGETYVIAQRKNRYFVVEWKWTLDRALGLYLVFVGGPLVAGSILVNMRIAAKKKN